MIKNCVICGKPFEPKPYNRSVCYDDHHHACPVCGKDIVCNDPKRQNCACSKKCGQQMGNVSRVRTAQEKYGVDNISKLDSVKEKISEGNKAVKTKENTKFAVCVICGKQFELTWPYNQKTCSQKCKNVYVKESGVSKQRAAKAQQTLKIKYGVSNTRQLQHFVRDCKWCGKKFETNEPNQMYCGDDWGKCPVCGKPVKIKDYSIGSQTCSEECRQARIAETNLLKYGVAESVNSEQAKEKAKQTCLEKYGVNHYSKSLLFTKQMMSDIENSEKYLEFKSNPLKYIHTHFRIKPTIVQLANDFGVTDMAIYQQLNKFNCRDAVVLNKSTMEQELFEYISSIYSGKIIMHDRQVIKPLEMDMYLPELKLGLECNSTYIHNSSLGTIWSDSVTPENYHMLKSIEASKAGVFLFHVFGYEWTHEQDIIKSMVANLVGGNVRTIYARNLVVKEISYQDSLQFLVENHRQGGCVSSVRLGLYCDDEFVSLMTFGSLRQIVSNEAAAEDEYELLRFCSKKYTSVVGGASKLFSHFVKHYKPKRVVSYSDIAHTRGTLYEKLSFHLVSISSSPGYVWVNSTTDNHLNRVQCQKQYLKKLFHDDTIDVEHKTEKEIMIEHGYVQVFDSGVIKWEWTEDT